MRKFYIWDTRSMVGNCVLFWRANSMGYTCDIREAGLYDEQEALEIQASRGTDRAVPREIAEAFIVHHVRAERMRDALDCWWAQERTKEKAASTEHKP